MSHFSNQLERSMEDAGLTQIAIHVKTNAEISQASVSRYCSGDRPTRDAFEKLLDVFPERYRTALVLAYAIDDVPEKYRKLITITPATARGRITEEPAIYRSRMSKKLRTAYDGLGARAIEKPDTAQAVISFYEALKASTA